MSEIKKAYVGIVEFLKANDQKKVSTVLPHVITMCTARRTASANTFIKDTTGKVVAVLDSFYKKWMPLVGEQAVEFGVKAGTTTGLSDKCKDGNNEWTRLNRIRKNSIASMLDDLKSGDLEPAGISDREVEIQKTFEDAIAASVTEKGFDDKEDVIEYLEGEGYELIVTE
jgi:hypothetical protein